jgi:hypothetical protein
LPQIVWNGFQADDYVLEPGSDFETAMRSAHREVMGDEPQETLLPAVTDCRFYGRYYDIPSLSYGPASTDGHGFDEFVELESLKKATLVIARFIGVKRLDHLSGKETFCETHPLSAPISDPPPHSSPFPCGRRKRASCLIILIAPT